MLENRSSRISCSILCCDWLARRAGERLKKGHPVAVVGSLRPKTWTDAEGKPRKRVEIYAENLCFSPLASSVQAMETREDTTPDGPLPDRAEVPF